MIKPLFIILGTISLFLGILGIFIPGLPTTPFLLLTAGLYVRSSHKLYALVTRNKYIGNYIRNYQTNKGLDKNTKISAIILMWTMIILSVTLFIEILYIQIIIFILGIIGTIVMGYIIPTIKNP